MRVIVYPADSYGCGYHRLIWPVEVLRAQGHDVQVVKKEERQLVIHLQDDGEVTRVDLADDFDVVVLQRVTHRNLAGSVRALRRQGVAVVVDVDDDLSTIHPDNPAWRVLHPTAPKADANAALHSWRNLDAACRDATLVTATTPALAKKYALHGRSRVFPNYLAAHYYGREHVDSDVVGWPASLGSHPNDPSVVGNAVARLVDEGAPFHVVSTSPGAARAFGIRDPARVSQVDHPIDLLDWPGEVSKLGIGIAPLADTKFNHAKSWLKPLELAALGVPWVGSPRPEYRRLHELGCGLLAEKPAGWYRALRALRSQEQWRLELSESGRAVAAQLKLEDHAWKLWEAWSDALALQRNVTTATITV